MAHHKSYQEIFMRIFNIILSSVIVLAVGYDITILLAQEIIVKPYVQPGDGNTLEGKDVKIIAWLTDQKDADFTVEYGLKGEPVLQAKPVKVSLDFEKAKTIIEIIKPKVVQGEAKSKEDEKKEPAAKKDPPLVEKEQHYFRYHASLTNLPFNSEIDYCVKAGDRIIRQSSFRTRPTPDKSARLVLVGDMATGKAPQKAIAWQIQKEKPEALIALGDIVYPTGRVLQYMNYFWNTYNDVKEPGPANGAPLMASIPFYPLLGNHDIGARFPTTQDALGAFYFFYPPTQGPGEGSWSTPLGTDTSAVAKFKTINKHSYPSLDAYSFDYGSAHFLILNNNKSSNMDSAELLKWAKSDLTKTKQPWKFVCYHVPAFHSSKQHYSEQQSRSWNPMFEECGVDIVFAGHVHNYQRSHPLLFKPEGKRNNKGRVDGTFTIDNSFDGEKNTNPKGVIHVVAGGGGASLYLPGLEKTSVSLKEDFKENYADFTAILNADGYSFVSMDMEPTKLAIRVLNQDGKQIDKFNITKPKR